jgi:death-on-curing protein
MKWVSGETVLAIHRRQISEHGGEPGVRDTGLLQSALARPQNISACSEGADIASLAAAYAFGIAKNDPFIDGNKRTALVVMRTFLLLNGFNLKAAQEEKYLTFMSLAAGKLSEDELSEWMRKRLYPGR